MTLKWDSTVTWSNRRDSSDLFGATEFYLVDLRELT